MQKTKRQNIRVTDGERKEKKRKEKRENTSKRNNLSAANINHDLYAELTVMKLCG